MSPKVKKEEQGVSYIPPKPFTFGPQPDLIVKVHEGSKLIHIHDYPPEEGLEGKKISHQLSMKLDVDDDNGELKIYIYTADGDTITEMKVSTSLSRI